MGGAIGRATGRGFRCKRTKQAGGPSSETRSEQMGALVGAGLGMCGVSYALTYRYIEPSLWGVENAIGLCLVPLICPFGRLTTRAIVGALIFVLMPEGLRALSLVSPYETYVRNLIFFVIALGAGVSGKSIYDRASSPREPVKRGHADD